MLLRAPAPKKNRADGEKTEEEEQKWGIILCQGNVIVFINSGFLFLFRGEILHYLKLAAAGATSASTVSTLTPPYQHESRASVYLFFSIFSCSGFSFGYAFLFHLFGSSHWFCLLYGWNGSFPTRCHIFLSISSLCAMFCEPRLSRPRLSLADRVGLFCLWRFRVYGVDTIHTMTQSQTPIKTSLT